MIIEFDLPSILGRAVGINNTPSLKVLWQWEKKCWVFVKKCGKQGLESPLGISKPDPLRLPLLLAQTFGSAEQAQAFGGSSGEGVLRAAAPPPTPLRFNAKLFL